MELSKEDKMNAFLAFAAVLPTLTINGLVLNAVYRNINSKANTINGTSGYGTPGPSGAGRGPGNNALIVSITAPTGTTAGTPTNFTASVGGGTQPYSILWSFGDGTSGSGTTVTHTWRTGGTYQITVSVRDSAGNGGQASIMFQVGLPPFA